MAECRVDIIKNGYVYTDNFTVGVAPLIDSQGNEVLIKKQNLEFVLTSSAGIDVTTVIPSIGLFNIVTGVWTIPEITSDQKQYLSFMATVNDETLGPYEVILEGTVLPDDSDASNNTKIICLGGITRGDILNEVDTLVGPSGPVNVLTIGTVTTGVASASITGTAPVQVLNLVLPEPIDGEDGINGDTLSIGSVATLAPGSPATATISGTSPNKLLNLGIPEGIDGAASGGETNVQSDWAENNPAFDTYILNKPIVPAAQVNTDWSATTGVSKILNKPTLTATGGNVTGLINLATGLVNLTAENTQLDKETVQDHAAELFQHSAHSNISAFYNDPTNELILSVDPGLDTITSMTQSGDDLVVVGTGTAFNDTVADVFKDTQNVYSLTKVGNNLILAENGVDEAPIDISAHTHAIGDIVQLQTSLDEKQDILTSLDITSNIDVGGNVNQTNGTTIAVTFQIVNNGSSATDRPLVFLTSIPDGFEFVSVGSSTSGITYDQSSELLTVQSGLASIAFEALSINVTLNTMHSGVGGVLKKVRISPTDYRGHEGVLTAYKTQSVRVF